ncbi:MAG: AAA family ATPase [Acidobacteriota bacterium]
MSPPDGPAPAEPTVTPGVGDPPPTAVEAAELRWSLDPSSLGFASTAELEWSAPFRGQERALEALQLAVELDQPGYNAFVLGLSGAARLDAARAAVASVVPPGREVPDRAYVFNFQRPQRPRLLELPPGRAGAFAADLADGLRQLEGRLVAAFEDKSFLERMDATRRRHAERERELLDGLREQAQERGLHVATITDEDGPRLELLVQVGEQVLSFDDVEGLRAGRVELEEEEGEAGLVAALQEQVEALDLEALLAVRAELEDELRRGVIAGRQVARSLQNEVATLEREAGLSGISGFLTELLEEHGDEPRVRSHLEDLRRDLLAHLHLCKTRGLDESHPDRPGGDPAAPTSFQDLIERYRVNVVSEGHPAGEAPVLIEALPGVRSLFGAVRGRLDRFGRSHADHRSVATGSLLAADGGILIMEAGELVSDLDAWTALKRVLVTQSLDLRELSRERDPSGGPVPWPEPIPLSAKVVLVGDHETYDLLHQADKDFQHAMRIRAEFDPIGGRDRASVVSLATGVAELCRREGLRPLTVDAIARLAEHAARLAAEEAKMVTDIDLLADPVRQASLLAARAGDEEVGAKAVQQVLVDAERRCSLWVEHLRENQAQGKVLLRVSGQRVGEINALAVRSTIEHAFGHPVRITAVVGQGNTGLINIEREVKLSGQVHDKGVFIALGYLTGQYADRGPLTFSASLAFEQLYGGIDGDSATAAEICALLSALSEWPLDQGLALTGSMNQLGEIQPVGGVDEKIEGFFDACCSLGGGRDGLTGKQGVIIPRSNVADLMLRADVVEAVREGRFHVHAVTHVDEVLELLTGRRAGRRHVDGFYEDGTLHHAVSCRLEQLAMGGQVPAELSAAGAGASLDPRVRSAASEPGSGESQPSGTEPPPAEPSAQ